MENPQRSLLKELRYRVCNQAPRELDGAWLLMLIEIG